MEIRRLMEQAEDAENVLHAQVLTGMPSGGGVSDPTANAVRMRDHALHRVDQLTAEINEIMERKDKLDAIIGLLPNNYQQIIHMRYCQRLNVSVQIPAKMHISERTAVYWMTKTIEKIADFCAIFGVQ